jgi:hypothetical protein
MLLKKIQIRILQNFKSSILIDYKKIENSILSLNLTKDKTSYVFAKSQKKENLYSSVFGILCLFIINSKIIKNDKNFDLIYDYLQGFQDPCTGLFYDHDMELSQFKNRDWWGFRHIVPIILNLYGFIKKKPKYEFNYLNEYKNKKKIDELLDSFSINQNFTHEFDLDNKLMNIFSVMQYERDFLGKKNNEFIQYFKTNLKKKINKRTGIWGGEFTSLDDFSRKIQFAYHLLCIYFYDNDFNFQINDLIKKMINFQNNLGAFAKHQNFSSACEDMDFSYILMKFYPLCSEKTKDQILKVIKKNLIFNLANLKKDLFVFKYSNEDFEYGSKNCKSLGHEGNTFATWFRILLYKYHCDFLKIKNNFQIIKKFPGY